MDPTLVGLISLAFAMAVQIALFSFLLGGLFQRVKSNTARIRELENGEKGDGAGRTDLLVRLAQLETRFEMSTQALSDHIAALQRETHGLARQVAALTTRRRGAVPPLADTQSED